MSAKPIVIHRLGLREYQPTWQAMRDFTDKRKEDTPSELWLVEHPPVFTQGQAGKAEHLLQTGDIPVVQTDRGGQVTYHGPGQLVIYLLLSLREAGIGIRGLVTIMEQAIIDLLGARGIDAAARAGLGVPFDDAGGAAMRGAADPHCVEELARALGRGGCAFVQASGSMCNSATSPTSPQSCTGTG